MKTRRGVSLDAKAIVKLEEIARAHKTTFSECVNEILKRFVKRKRGGRVVTVRGKDQRSEVKL